MSDLISKSTLFEEIERQKSSLDKDCEWSYNMTLNIVDIFSELINKQPTVETNPVVNGEWIEEKGVLDWFYSCSECNSLSEYKTNFCKTCGADMRGGKNE